MYNLRVVCKHLPWSINYLPYGCNAVVMVGLAIPTLLSVPPTISYPHSAHHTPTPASRTVDWITMALSHQTLFSFWVAFIATYTALSSICSAQICWLSSVNCLPLGLYKATFKVHFTCHIPTQPPSHPPLW